MRRIISVLISVFFLTTALEAGTISYSLRKKMEKASPDQMFLVRIVMQEQFDTHQCIVNLSKKKAKFPEMHKAVIDGLQRTAKRTQGNVLKILAEEKKNGNVLRYRSFWISNFVKFRGTAAVIRKIASLSEVYLVTEPPKYIYPKPIKIAPDPVDTKGDTGAVSNPWWDLKHIKAPRLWNMGYKGHLAWAPILATGDTNRVLIGDVDTGPDALHPALYWKWKHYLVHGDTLFHAKSDTQYWYYPGGDTYGVHGDTLDKWWPYDPGKEACHGTHTLGTMVGMEENGHNPVGVAPEGMFIACRASDGSGDLNNISACVQFMTDPNSDGNSTTDVPVAVNNSYGYSPSNGCVTNDETDIKNAENAGVAMIFAIGNSGPDASTSISSGQNNWSDYSAFSVGAVMRNYDASGNEDDTIADFSSRGPTDCSEGADTVKPEVSAPGVLIRSTFSKHVIGRAGTNFYGYEMISGTSMATPHVTGAYGLLYSIFGDTLKKLYGGASSGSGFAWMDSIKSAMMHSADDRGAQGNDNTYGWGKLNLARAYEYLNNMIAGGVANGNVVKAEVYKDSIDDNTSLSSINNANGIADYGETVNLTLYLVQDYGTSYDLAGTQATLTSSDPYVSIISSGPDSFTDINSTKGDTLMHNWNDTLSNAATPFQIRVSRFAPAGYSIDLIVEVTGTVVQTGASLTDTAMYRLEVSRPQLISTIDLKAAGETYYHASGLAYDVKNNYLYVFAQDGSYKPGGQYYDVSTPSSPSKLGNLSGLSLGHYTMGATFDPTGYLLVSEGDSIIKFSVSDSTLTRQSGIAIEGVDYSGSNHKGMPIRIRGISYATAVDRATGLLGTADSLYAWYHSYDTTNYPANRYGSVPMINSGTGETLAYWGPSGRYGYDSYMVEPDSCYAAFSFPNGRAATWDGHMFWTTFQSSQLDNNLPIRSYVARRDFRPGHYLANVYEFGTPGQYISQGDSSLLYSGAWQMPYYLWQTDWDQFKVWCFDASQIVLPRPPRMINQYHPGLDTFSLPNATPGVTPDTIYWHPRDSTEFVDTFYVYRDSVGTVAKNGRKALTLLGKTTDTFYVDTPDNKGEYLYAVSSKNIWGEGLYNYPDDDIDVAYGGTFTAIELSSFSLSAISNGVIVLWRAETQSGINKWVVERKGENSRWNKIAEMQTKGSPSNYRYLDRNVKYGRLYTYRIGAVSINGTKYYPPTSIRFYGRGTPTVFDISRVYPNPFSNTATIKYQLPEKADVSMKVYDITGRERTTLVNKTQEPGYYTIRWKPMDMPSGVYFCRMVAGKEFEKTVKMTFTK